MKKHIIFLSAVLMGLSVMSGCADKNVTEQESQTETVQETTEPTTEPTTKKLIEIDPFEGLEFSYHHTKNGTIEEKEYNAFERPQKSLSITSQKKYSV